MDFIWESLTLSHTDDGQLLLVLMLTVFFFKKKIQTSYSQKFVNGQIEQNVARFAYGNILGMANRHIPFLKTLHRKEGLKNIYYRKTWSTTECS
jgi:hypothetical protein